jgi:hypothetical protein
MGAALLVVFSGVGVTVSSSRLLGLIVVLAASLVLIAIGVRLAVGAKDREKKQLLAVLFGYSLAVCAFAISVFDGGLVATAILLIGTLIGLVGSVSIAIAANLVEPTK